MENQHQMPPPQTAEDRTVIDWDRPVLSGCMTCSQRLGSLAAKPVGLAHFRRNIAPGEGLQHLSSRSWFSWYFPGALQQGVTEMLELRCPQGQAVVPVCRARLSPSRAPVTEGAPLERGRPPCFPASAPEGADPTVPSGTRQHNTIGQRGTAGSLGLAGQDRRQHAIGQAHPSASAGPWVEPTSSKHSSSPTSPPRRGLAPNGHPQAVAVTPRPSQAPSRPSRDTLPALPATEAPHSHQPQWGTSSWGPVTAAPPEASPQQSANTTWGCEEASRHPPVPSTHRCCLLRPRTSTSAPTVW